ncbi:MAG: hypothetical protein Barrevirus9_19 [Barrevirus sp.]|uniref:Endonuclease/exonuclease/phosphatase domain-containing protein n=1 Tax=Barrevirus sp. TaxID=2487763 RepID=A0A3G4ZQ71_9VIRU|nr:MAG: hypothetical protein Barrevirus9_19 [Barrevirus sp.]
MDQPENDPFKYSDHLPTITIIKGLRFGTWNVLYQKWLKMNIDGHIGKFFSNLVTMVPDMRSFGIIFTIYDLLVLQKLDVLALQEFDLTNLEKLKQMLVHLGNYELILPEDLTGYVKVQEDELHSQGNNDLQLVIYCKDTIKHNTEVSHLEYFVHSETGTKKISKRIMNLSFSAKEIDSVSEFRFINTHVLFLEIRQLIKYVNAVKKPDNQKELNIIIAGDMNQEERPDTFIGLLLNYSFPFTVTYTGSKVENIGYTHIDTKGSYVQYDHIWHIII